VQRNFRDLISDISPGGLMNTMKNFRQGSRSPGRPSLNLGPHDYKQERHKLDRNVLQ
jgi:hypothetical protein